MKRRALLGAAVGSAALSGLARIGTAHPNAMEVSSNDRKRGLLLGGLIGDALGGPLEFSSASPKQKGTADVRSWKPTPISKAQIEELATSLPLRDYVTLRPDTASYGPWRPNAPLGTLTDDSRHKIVLLQALKRSQAESQPLSREAIAKSFIQFRSAPDAPGIEAEKLAKLNEEGFREYRYAAKWLLGERNLSKARPVERLWAGVNNCSGQMMFPPLAAAFAGEPEAAYRATYHLDFIDTPFARDFTAALNAGLSAALSPELDSANDRQRWEALLSAMRNTDPYQLENVPFAGRQLERWLDRCDQWIDEAQGIPSKLFRILETKGQPEFWWDAHFTLVVPVCILRLCDFNPLAAMHMTLDFGHDSDSYAQVLGCMIGTVHGSSVFPDSIGEAVTETLRVDYGESIDAWLESLQSISIEEY